MKRVLMVLTVALVLGAMVVVSAMPAFAFEFNASGKNPAGNKAPGQSQNPNPGK